MKYLKVWTNFLELMKTLEYDEMGRLFEMMLIYADSGKEPDDIDGNERFLWPVAKQQIDLAAEKNEILRLNGLKGGRPKTKRNQTKPNETKENQTEANESYKEKKRKEIERKDISSYDDSRACAREAAAADDDVNRINREHIRLLDAAENAGFQKSNSVRERLIALYADHGLEKMLAGIASCVQHGVSNLAYLEGCLSDRPKKKDKVPAQDYAQRDYSGEQDAAMERLMHWHERKEANGA